MMTRKHAEALAAAIKDARKETSELFKETTAERELSDAVLDNIQERVFAVLIDSNPRMDYERFNKACEL